MSIQSKETIFDTDLPNLLNQIDFAMPEAKRYNIMIKLARILWQLFDSDLDSIKNVAFEFFDTISESGDKELEIASVIALIKTTYEKNMEEEIANSLQS